MSPIADTKISDLTALTGAGTATGDLVPIVDVSASATKNQSIAQLGVALNGVGGLALSASPTFTGTAVHAIMTATGTFTHGTAEAFAIKGRYLTGVIAVAVPSLTNLADGAVDVDISADPLVFAAAVGDEVTAIPQAALPTHALVANAYVINTDSVRVVFVSDGTSVTGASVNFKFLITDLT